MAARPEIDWYSQLGVHPGATSREIDAAYRRLARALHPDSGNQHPVDVERLQLVIQAHDILSRPDHRRAYDQRRARADEQAKTARSVVCPVCRGTRLITTPCTQCSGRGRQSSGSGFLPELRRCRTCVGTGLRRMPCGACGASGRISQLWRDPTRRP
jgi:DnaJ-class molecular chaperone